MPLPHRVTGHHARFYPSSRHRVPGEILYKLGMYIEPTSEQIGEMAELLIRMEAEEQQAT